MKTIREIVPDVPDHIEKMVAEVLTVWGRTQEERRAARIRKLKTFPESCQEQVREVANRVIVARNGVTETRTAA